MSTKYAKAHQPQLIDIAGIFKIYSSDLQKNLQFAK
tara:strand:- start:281 stop:388 length:108 start_codon:yes stop_codon:yes gene_type:complete